MDEFIACLFLIIGGLIGYAIGWNFGYDYAYNRWHGR